MQELKTCNASISLTKALIWVLWGPLEAATVLLGKDKAIGLVACCFFYRIAVMWLSVLQVYYYH